MPVIKTSLDLFNTRTPPVVFLKQYDKTDSANGKSVEFSLYSDSLPYAIPEGAVVVLRGTKPDNTGYSYACTYDGNVVHLKVQEQMTVLSGKHSAEIRISKQGDILGTASLTFDIARSALSDTTPISKTDLPDIEKAVEAYEKVNEKVAEVDANTKKAAVSATNAKASEDAASTSASTSASYAKKAEDAYKQAVAIGGVGLLVDSEGYIVQAIQEI